MTDDPGLDPALDVFLNGDVESETDRLVVADILRAADAARAAARWAPTWLHPVAMADTSCGWVVDHTVEEAGAWSPAEPIIPST